MFDSNDNPTRSDFALVMRWGLFILLAGFLLYLGGHALGVFGTVATAPGRVVNKTLETDNIVSSYEWFYDVNAQFDARRGQIAGHTKLIATEQDKQERSRLNIELAAMRQSCRDLATKYNANSEKANKSLFKSRGLPESLSTTTCEV